MKFIFTYHAKDQARERGIYKNEIIDCIKRGSKYRQGKEKLVALYRHIKVVFKVKHDKCVVITIMIKGEKNGK